MHMPSSFSVGVMVRFCLFWVLSCRRCLSLLETDPSSVSTLTNMFAHSVGCLFVLQKYVCLIRSTLWFLSCHSSRRWIWEDVAMVNVRECRARFSSKCLRVSGLILRSIIHFEFSFLSGVRRGSNCILWQWPSSFPNTMCGRDCLFSIVYTCLLCHRGVDCRCMGFLLGFHPVPLMSISGFVPVPNGFNDCCL